jgi:glycosyltransferase involved in cell wall biosynthesis
MKKTISVVIAAYNEAPRIANVLKIVEHHPIIDEVIVVNDGSKDNTSEIVKKFDVTLIDNEKNMGKTLSVKRGIEASKSELIMLLDADLNGLTDESINRLAQPVLDGQVDWTLSLRDNSWGFMRLVRMDWVSGERVVPKELLLDPLIWSRPDIGFGLETLMNKSLLMKNKTFCSVRLPNVTNTIKSEKIGFFKGWMSDFKMINNISKVMPLHRMIGQFISMAYRNKKYTKK